jgi:hypothetical protein
MDIVFVFCFAFCNPILKGWINLVDLFGFGFGLILLLILLNLVSKAQLETLSVAAWKPAFEADFSQVGSPILSKLLSC